MAKIIGNLEFGEIEVELDQAEREELVGYEKERDDMLLAAVDQNRDKGPKEGFRQAMKDVQSSSEIREVQEKLDKRLAEIARGFDANFKRVHIGRLEDGVIVIERGVTSMRSKLHQKLIKDLKNGD